ncbi:restriction endonuclease [Streptomyces crystallinus]
MESVATPLAWSRLDADGFERLLFDLLRSFPEHHNVQWLSHTRAADRGRDLSMDRVIPLSTGRTRTERVIVQAKHWSAKSVGLPDIAATVAATKVWEPPVVRTLIIATSGRFSADAIAWAERHNETGTAPFVELWPESHLETLLARRPRLIALYGLR